MFSQVVLHEMSHSLGFGSIWDRSALVTNGLYTGANAVANILAMGGGGISGRAGWRRQAPPDRTGTKTTFHNELMTGYINDGPNYFTAMSEA